jgi:putative oxidoreductase
MTMLSEAGHASTGTARSAALAILNRLDSLPLWPVQLVARIAVAREFWQSAQSKLASWQVTEQLFAFEYNLPLIDPAIAARLATATEIAGALMVAFGLLSRLGASMLLGVTATIQIFVYPQSWPEHLMWAALLLLIVLRGPGVVSLDHLIRRWQKA